MAEDTPHVGRDWPDDAPHKAARDVIESIADGKLTRPARTAVRKALDVADAPLTGRPRMDEALNRSVRF